MTVNRLSINMIALALGVAFSAGSMAAGISKDDYRAAKDSIAARYKSARADCASLSGNPNDICVAEAKGKEKVALADLEASYKPSRKSYYEARVAKAEANYAVSSERCDAMAGNAKDVCVKEAKAAETFAKADAKAQMKTSDANAAANKQSADARKDAAADKLEAQYGVAKEQCDRYAGGAKDHCLEQAKARFGKS